MKKFFLLVSCIVIGASLLAQPKVEHLGALQGENVGQPGFSYQGMDIYGDYMLSCQNQGIATVYRLSGKTFKALGQFHLKSFHEYNHANVVTFGLEKAQPSDPMPVAYISHCSKHPIDGMKDVLYAERILPDFSGSELLQTIFYDDVNKDFGYALQWVIDQEEKMLYGYGNTVNNSDPSNRHRIIKFRLPSLSEGKLVVLKPEDALENYLIEDESGFRFNPVGQGLFIENGTLYMPTGVGKVKTPSVLYIWDLKARKMQGLDLSLVSTGEFEDISRYGKWFYIQGQDGIFRLRAKDAVGSADFGWRDLTPGMVYDARPEEVAAYGKAEQEEAVKTIAEFAENVVGIKEANYKERTLSCQLPSRPEGKVGLVKYRFGKIVCTIIITAKKIEVESNKKFSLIDGERTFTVLPGKNKFRR